MRGIKVPDFAFYHNDANPPTKAIKWDDVALAIEVEQSITKVSQKEIACLFDFKEEARNGMSRVHILQIFSLMLADSPGLATSF